MTHELTHLDLFSGIGGFALAAGWAGFRTAGFSEVEPYAGRVLEKRWPGVPNVGDVRVTANFARFRGVTVLTGGFPCQPWSAAGDQRGLDDHRHLWPAMLSVIEVARPTWIIGENVPGLDHLGQLDACCDDLARIGYECQPFEIPACAVDAPHIRQRLWIIAHRNGSPGAEPHLRTIKSEQQAPRQDDAERLCPALADTERAERRPERETLRRDSGFNGLPQGEGSPVRTRGGRQTLGHADCSRLEIGKSQPSDDGQKLEAAQRTGLVRGAIRGGRWLPEPRVGRVAHGVPDRSHRLKGLGNAIVPEVAAPFLKWIAQIETQELTQ